jgi:hypothetical protein
LGRLPTPPQTPDAGGHSVRFDPSRNLGAVVARRLIDFRDARLETGERSRRKVAVVFNRVEAVFDTAHVGLAFTDVIGDSHSGARTCIALPFDETQRSVSDARMPGRSRGTRSRTTLFFRVSLCRPTASELPICGTGTSVRHRFLGNSRASRCLPVLNTWGVGT